MQKSDKKKLGALKWANRFYILFRLFGLGKQRYNFRKMQDSGGRYIIITVTCQHEIDEEPLLQAVYRMFENTGWYSFCHQIGGDIFFRVNNETLERTYLPSESIKAKKAKEANCIVWKLKEEKK